MSEIQLEVDMMAGAAYIRLSTSTVHRTVQATDSVLIDLDDMGVAVGVEVLVLAAEIPFSRLKDDFHVHSDVVELLRQIQPSVAGYLELTQASEGTTESVRATSGQLA